MGVVRLPCITHGITTKGQGMKITLLKKNDGGDKEPLLVMYEEGPEGKREKRTLKVSIGQSLTLADEVASQIVGKYPGLWGFGDQPEPSAPKKGYADKAMAATGG